MGYRKNKKLYLIQLSLRKNGISKKDPFEQIFLQIFWLKLLDLCINSSRKNGEIGLRTDCPLFDLKKISSKVMWILLLLKNPELEENVISVI